MPLWEAGKDKTWNHIDLEVIITLSVVSKLLYDIKKRMFWSDLQKVANPKSGRKYILHNLGCLCELLLIIILQNNELGYDGESMFLSILIYLPIVQRIFFFCKTSAILFMSTQY